MKTLKIILIVAIICAQNCFAQRAETSEVNFFDFIKRSINIKDCYLNQEITISYFRCGFDMYETNKNGTGVLFAVPQKEFGIWKKENKSEWKREDLWENSQEKIKNAREFLFFSKDTLCVYFDVFVFYVKQNDIVIEGTYMTDDGQLIDDYYVIDDATIYMYKLEYNVWVEKNKNNIEGNSIRGFGEEIVEKILQERFGEVI